MERCDAVVLCSGWPRSSGSRAEKIQFVEQNLGPVFDFSNAFRFVSGSPTEVNSDDEEYKRFCNWLAT